MTCDSCGRELPPDARFCPGCGTAVADMRGDGDPGPTTAAEPAPTGETAAGPEPRDEAEVEVGEADDEQEAPTPEALPSEASAKTRPAPATILGNVLAVAAGGTLGVLVGLAIRQAM